MRDLAFATDSADQRIRASDRLVGVGVLTGCRLVRVSTAWKRMATATGTLGSIALKASWVAG